MIISHTHLYATLRIITFAKFLLPSDHGSLLGQRSCWSVLVLGQSLAFVFIFLIPQIFPTSRIFPLVTFFPDLLLLSETTSFQEPFVLAPDLLSGTQASHFTYPDSLHAEAQQTRNHLLDSFVSFLFTDWRVQDAPLLFSPGVIKIHSQPIQIPASK